MEKVINEIEIQRKLLKTIVKQVETRIKEVQQSIKDSYTQEDVLYQQGIEHELISWKIYLEKMCKKIKYGGTL